MILMRRERPFLRARLTLVQVRVTFPLIIRGRSNIPSARAWILNRHPACSVLQTLFATARQWSAPRLSGTSAVPGPATPEPADASTRFCALHCTSPTPHRPRSEADLISKRIVTPISGRKNLRDYSARHSGRLMACTGVGEGLQLSAASMLLIAGRGREDGRRACLSFRMRPNQPHHPHGAPAGAAITWPEPGAPACAHRRLRARRYKLEGIDEGTVEIDRSPAE